MMNENMIIGALVVAAGLQLFVIDRIPHRFQSIVTVVASSIEIFGFCLLGDYVLAGLIAVATTGYVHVKINNVRTWAEFKASFKFN